MNIDIYLRANQDTVIIAAPMANLNVAVKNVVTVTNDLKGEPIILAFGYDADDLEHTAPEKWKKEKIEVILINIYYWKRLVPTK